jgi:hypothetical protein
MGCTTSLADRPRRLKTRKPVKAGAALAAAADKVPWTVYLLDGTTFSVALRDHDRVAEAKRAIGALRGVPHYAIEIFVEGKEEPLKDETLLLSEDKVPLFVLPKEVSDRQALEALFRSCGGANWNRKGGWMTDADIGSWDGVSVNAEGRVTHLHLISNNMAGPLPSEIQQLSATRCLWLNRNQLTGPIPAELGKLGALKALYLHTNQLTGSVPAELGRLPALTELVLHNNQLSGPIPLELGKDLKQLVLYNNWLSGQEEFANYMSMHNPYCHVDLVDWDWK